MIQQYSFEMCKAKLYGHSTYNAVSIDTRNNKKLESTTID